VAVPQERFGKGSSFECQKGLELAGQKDLGGKYLGEWQLMAVKASCGRKHSIPRRKGKEQGGGGIHGNAVAPSSRGK